jgi:hypothetical protein
MSTEAQLEISRFAADLTKVRLVAGNPSHKRILTLARGQATAAVSVNTLRNAEQGKWLPSMATVITYIRGCYAAAAESGAEVDRSQFSVPAWQERWTRLKAIHHSVPAAAGELHAPAATSTDQRGDATALGKAERPGQIGMWLPNLENMTYLLLADSKQWGWFSLDEVAKLGDRFVLAGRLDQPYGIAALLAMLRKAHADEQIRTLLELDLVAGVAVDDASNVTLLLEELMETGADEQATVLARRAAASTPLSNLYCINAMLAVLRKASANNAIAVLLERDPATSTPIDDGFYVAELLGQLWEIGAHQQAMRLANRSVTGVEFGDQGEGVAVLVRALLEIGAETQADELSCRSDFLKDALGFANFLWCLREVGADKQVAALLKQDLASSISLDGDISELVRSYWEAGAEQQAVTLVNRAAANGQDWIVAQFEILSGTKLTAERSTATQPNQV